MNGDEMKIKIPYTICWKCRGIVYRDFLITEGQYCIKPGIYVEPCKKCSKKILKERLTKRKKERTILDARKEIRR